MTLSYLGRLEFDPGARHDRIDVVKRCADTVKLMPTVRQIKIGSEVADIMHTRKAVGGGFITQCGAIFHFGVIDREGGLAHGQQVGEGPACLDVIVARFARGTFAFGIGCCESQAAAAFMGNRDRAIDLAPD